MHERPLRAQYRGPAAAAASVASTGGENLSSLIVQIEDLRLALGYARWSHLKAWCDSGDPLTADRGELERLIERLCVVWENRGGGHA